MFLKAAEISEIADGGMKAVGLNGRAIVLCNYEGRFYAVERKCGHAGVHLERGALTGYILTCPLHCAQFDITTGRALSGPVPEAPASGYPDPAAPSLKTRDLASYPVRLVSDAIEVDLPTPDLKSP